MLAHYQIIINTFSVDSGGQYADGGTTDVTRTFHYGTPSSNQVWTKCSSRPWLAQVMQYYKIKYTFKLDNNELFGRSLKPIFSLFIKWNGILVMGHGSL